MKEQTISRYVKETLVLAHSNQDPESVNKLVLKGHTVRHVATSLKALRSCSLREVMGAGAWASTNMFLSHYVQSYTANQLSKLADLGGLSLQAQLTNSYMFFIRLLQRNIGEEGEETEKVMHLKILSIVFSVFDARLVNRNIELN